MNYRMICRVLGGLLLINALLLLLPAIVGLAFRETVWTFLQTAAVSAAAGALLWHLKPKRKGMVARDGFVTVSLGWILFSLLDALPFCLDGSIPAYTDALFETVSGFTTTGATVLQDFAGMPHCDMFWRLFTHWIGGMGFLVFLMAVLPMSGEHSMHIMRAEVPGPVVGKLVPRAKRTATILYMIYVLLTLIEMLCLRISGMSFYEAMLHAFSTAGTGGFSTRAGSIADFHSPAIEWIITVFMLLFAVNFNLYFMLLIGSWRRVLQNRELRFFIGIVLSAALLIAGGLILKGFFEPGDAVRNAFFNVATVISTTGFGTADFTAWPEYCKWILLLLMLCGGCAGGTAGGIKVSRVMILFRSLRAQMQSMARPRSVVRVQLEGERVGQDTIHAAYGFVCLYFILAFLFSTLLSLDGCDIATGFTASLSCLSNVGPGMTAVIGPAGSFAFFSVRSKLMLCLAMLLGRLEIYPILVLIYPRTWQR